MNCEQELFSPWEQPTPVSPFQPWSVEYAHPKGIVVATARGHIFREDVRRQAEHVSQLLRQHKANRVLADCRTARVEISLTDIYWFPAYYSALTASRRFRIAVMVPATGYRMNSFKFYELRCRNAGFNVKLFSEYSDAEAWLQQTAISEP
jgi:hypothetical protein